MATAIGWIIGIVLCGVALAWLFAPVGAAIVAVGNAAEKSARKSASGSTTAQSQYSDATISGSCAYCGTAFEWDWQRGMPKKCLNCGALTGF